MTDQHAPRDTTSSTRSTTDAAHADVGIVCALAIESSGLLRQCERVRKYVGGCFVFRGGWYRGVRVAVVECGMGLQRAQAATEALLDAHTPDWVLSCGFAGALVPDLKIGHILVPTRVVRASTANVLPIDVRMPEDRRRGLFVGTLVSSEQMVRTVTAKKRLAEQFQALAVDMETWAVAEVCRRRRKPFMSVRVVSDDLSGDLPPEVLTVVGASGALRLGAAVAAVWKRPSSVKDMWRLRTNAYDASDRLAVFLDGVIEQLCSQPENA